MNHHRLARVMDISPFALYGMLDQEHFVTGWLLRRCTLCGKAELEYGDFIAQAGGALAQVNGAFMYVVCRDHGGTTGKVYADCLTGCAVEVPPSPNLLLKAIKDPLLELLYWAGVWRRYCTSFVWDGVHALRHPVAYRKYRKRMRGAKQ